MDAIKIHPQDTVAVALCPLVCGTSVLGVTLIGDIPQGHKFALTDIPCGADVIKYGLPVGHAVCDIPAGAREVPLLPGRFRRDRDGRRARQNVDWRGGPGPA